MSAVDLTRDDDLYDAEVMAAEYDAGEWSDGDGRECERSALVTFSCVIFLCFMMQMRWQLSTMRENGAMEMVGSATAVLL
jgi:hypothetical protein